MTLKLTQILHLPILLGFLTLTTRAADDAAEEFPQLNANAPEQPLLMGGWSSQRGGALTLSTAAPDTQNEEVFPALDSFTSSDSDDEEPTFVGDAKVNYVSPRQGKGGGDKFAYVDAQNVGRSRNIARVDETDKIMEIALLRPLVAELNKMNFKVVLSVPFKFLHKNRAAQACLMRPDEDIAWLNSEEGFDLLWHTDSQGQVVGLPAHDDRMFVEAANERLREGHAVVIVSNDKLRHPVRGTWWDYVQPGVGRYRFRSARHGLIESVHFHDQRGTFEDFFIIAGARPKDRPPALPAPPQPRPRPALKDGSGAGAAAPPAAGKPAKAKRGGGKKKLRKKTSPKAAGPKELSEAELKRFLGWVRAHPNNLSHRWPGVTIAPDVVGTLADYRQDSLQGAATVQKLGGMIDRVAEGSTFGYALQDGHLLYWDKSEVPSLLVARDRWQAQRAQENRLATRSDSGAASCDQDITFATAAIPPEPERSAPPISKRAARRAAHAQMIAQIARRRVQKAVSHPRLAHAEKKRLKRHLAYKEHQKQIRRNNTTTKQHREAQRVWQEKYVRAYGTGSGARPKHFAAGVTSGLQRNDHDNLLSFTSPPPGHTHYSWALPVVASSQRECQSDDRKCVMTTGEFEPALLRIKRPGLHGEVPGHTLFSWIPRHRYWSEREFYQRLGDTATFCDDGILIGPNMTNAQAMSQIDRSYKLRADAVGVDYTAGSSYKKGLALEPGQAMSVSFLNDMTWKKALKIVKAYLTEKGQDEAAFHRDYIKLVIAKTSGDSFGPEFQKFMVRWLEHLPIGGNGTIEQGEAVEILKNHLS